MKKLFTFVSALALLTACSGGTSTQNQNGSSLDSTANDTINRAPSASEQPVETPQTVDPYSVDNFSGKFVDFSKPVLITKKNSDGNEWICEYCRYDAENKIIEYGCYTGQYDYEGYIRMFKINYKGSNIDSVQWKEVYSNLVDEKKDIIFQQGISIFDKITGKNIGFLHDADKDVKNLDPKSIASMRKYADSKNDILERQYGRLYDFSDVKKWDNEKRDDKGRLTYSEYSEEYDLTTKYKIDYSYGGDFVKEYINLHESGEFEGESIDNEWNYTQTEKYLRTDKESESTTVFTPQEETNNVNIAEICFQKINPDIKQFRGDKLSCEGFGEEESEGCNSGAIVACYPFKDGRYLVVTSNFFSGPGCNADYWFGSNIYQNGNLDTTQVNALPIPKLDELLNPQKVDNYKKQIAEFRKMFDPNPDNYLYYEFLPPNKLKVELYPWDCEDAYCEMNKCMLSSNYDDKVLEYNWNGEKFVLSR